jgi:hypothetical protein
MNIPKIKRVKDPDEKYKPKKQIHPHLPNVQGYGGGSLLLMISPVKTGKSTIISNMLLSDEMYGQDYFDDVYILSNTIANDLTSRYLKDAFDVQDHYSDEFIDNIIERQKSFDKKDQPEIAIICDDCLGSIRQEARVNHLASRFRHYNIRLLLFSTQKFKGAVSPIIRGNATDVIVGSPFPNQKELLAVGDAYSDNFGGIDIFLKIYKLATPNRYDFLYLDLQQNPPLAYHNFEKLIARGGEIINENNND